MAFERLRDLALEVRVRSRLPTVGHAGPAGRKRRARAGAPEDPGRKRHGERRTEHDCPAATDQGSHRESVRRVAPASRCGAPLHLVRRSRLRCVDAPDHRPRPAGTREPLPCACPEGYGLRSRFATPGSDLGRRPRTDDRTILASRGHGGGDRISIVVTSRVTTGSRPAGPDRATAGVIFRITGPAAGTFARPVH